MSRRAISPQQLHARLSLGVVIAGLALLLAIPLGYLVNKTVWANELIADIEPRYARLLGLQQVAERIERSRDQADATLRAQAYPVSLDADRAGADLQQRLRALAQQAGLNMLGSQVVTTAPAPREGSPAALFERIAITVTLDADLSALQTMLGLLREERPAIHVESLNLQPARAAGDGSAQRLNVQMALNALRVMR